MHTGLRNENFIYANGFLVICDRWGEKSWGDGGQLDECVDQYVVAVKTANSMLGVIKQGIENKMVNIMLVLVTQSEVLCQVLITLSLK